MSYILHVILVLVGFFVYFIDHDRNVFPARHVNHTWHTFNQYHTSQSQDRYLSLKRHGITLRISLNLRKEWRDLLYVLVHGQAPLMDLFFASASAATTIRASGS